MRNNSFRELLAYATDNLKMYNATKDRRSSGFCFLKHLPLPLFSSAEQGGNELLQCGIGVIGWTPLEDSGWKCGQSLHLWECVGFELLGKDFERAHTKPSPSPSVSIFPSLPSYFSAAVFLSWLGTGAKLFFPPILASQAGTHRLTDIHKHTLVLFSSALSPHSSGRWLGTDLVLDYRLKSKYSHSPTWLLWLRVHIAAWEPSDCSEKCFDGKMSFRLTGHFSLLTSCYLCIFPSWHFLWFPVSLLARLLLSSSRADSLQKYFFVFFLAVWHNILVVSACLRKV